jgi:hypothetical protein
MWVFVLGCGRPKAPVAALPDPLALAQPGGRVEPESDEEPTLVPWVIGYAPPLGRLALTWRPGPEPDVLEIVLDTPRLPGAVEYVVEVNETHRPVIGEPLEEVEYVEGPFPVTEPWRVRPRGGVPPTLDSLSVTFTVTTREGVEVIVSSHAYFYHSAALGSIVALDPILAVRDFDLRRPIQQRSPYESDPLGQPGDDFLVPVERH